MSASRRAPAVSALLVAVFVASLVPAALAVPLGDLVDLQRDGNVVTIATSSGAAVRIEFLRDDVLRLQAGPDEKITGEGSGTAPIVLPQEAAAVAVAVTDAPDGFVLSTPAVALKVQRAPLLFTLSRTGVPAPLWRELKPLDLSAAGSCQVLAKAPAEHFLGGGQQNGSYEFNGRLLEISYSGGWEEGDRPSPAPFYMSAAGYGVLRNTWSDGAYDFRSEQYLVATHKEDRFDAYYFTGPDIHRVLELYTQWTGRAPLLPRWAFEYGDADCYNDRDNADKPGTVPAGWSDGPTGTTPDVVASVARKYREHDMPGGWILPNDGYGCGYTDLPAVVDSLRRLGFHTGLWTENGVEKIAWEVGTAGTRVQKLDVAWTGEGHQFAMDANRQAAQGILDNSDSRPFLWTVMGWAGMQRYAVTWTGDQAGNWDYIRWHIPTLIGSGLSGQAYATGDVDGIYGGSPETFTRDLQWKCFTPVLMGMSGWSKAERKHPWWFDEPYRSINRSYLKTKMRLMPYMYTLAKEAEDTGAPIVRGLMWDNPGDPHAWTQDHPNQFCLGRDLLVAPVFQAQAAGGGWREGIHLPQGTWIDYTDGTVTTAGPQGIDIAVPVTLEKLPVFVRGGAILPMYPAALYDGQVPTDVLTLDVYPQGSTQFELYEDDGNTRAYRDGAWSRQLFTANGEAGKAGEFTVTMEPVRGAFAGLHEERAYEVLLHTRVEPKSVTVDGTPLAQAKDADAVGWSYDADDRRGVVRVHTPLVNVREAHAVRVTCRGRAQGGGAHPQAPAHDAAISANGFIVVNRPAEEPGHPLENAFDGNPDTWFRTVRGQSNPYGPHEFVLAFNERKLVDGFSIRPRNDKHWKYGNVRRFEVYIADVNGQWGAPVVADTLALADSLQTVHFAAHAGRLLRFRVLSTHDMGRDPMVLGAAGAEADSGGAYVAAAPVNVSPVTIGEFRVLESRAANAVNQMRLSDPPAGRATGGGLRLFGVDYERGLNMRANSRADLALGGARRTLRADIGLAETATPDACARFQVWGDGRLLWDSGEVTGGAVAKPAIDVRGVRELSLRTIQVRGTVAAVWGNPVID